MESSWIVWVSVLIAWTLVGLVVAYLFGSLARRGEAEEVTTLTPKVSYMRRQKRASRPQRASTETAIRRASGGRSRH